MTVGRRTRRAVLSVHLVASLGWVGAVLAYLVLGVTAAAGSEVFTVRAAWWALGVVGSAAIVPLAIASLASGVVMSLLSPWGLVRHWWTVISLVLTTLAVVVTVLHMPTVRAVADVAPTASLAELRTYGGDLVHPGLGLVVLLVITVLNVVKPRGRTGLGPPSTS